MNFLERRAINLLKHQLNLNPFFCDNRETLEKAFLKLMDEYTIIDDNNQEITTERLKLMEKEELLSNLKKAVEWLEKNG